MDLREKKTIQNIENAFLQLRAQKPLERITVKELSELAQISKSTFYLHYEDVNDLSNRMQKDVIQKIFDSIPPFDMSFTDQAQFAKTVFQAFVNHSKVTDILFSGRQYYVLAFHVEDGMKEYVFQNYPHLRDCAEFNVLLSYIIQGAFSAYVENHVTFRDEFVFKIVSDISSNIAASHLCGLIDDVTKQCD